MQRTGMIVVDPRGTVQESYKTERRFYTHTRCKDVKKKFVLLKGKVLKAYFFQFGVIPNSIEPKIKTHIMLWNR